MALVITYTPPAYSSLQDDLIYTVSETVKTADPVTYPNYKFIGDVYVGAVLIARIKKVQDPVTGIGIFNIGQVVRSYITTTFNPAGSLLVAQQLGSGAFWLSIQVKFGEEYAYTSYYNITLDSARVFFNNYNGRRVGVDSSLTALANKVASSRPSIFEVASSSLFSFIPYFPTSTAAVSVTITPNVGSGFTTSFTPSNANDMQVLNVSPVALNAAHAGAIVAGTTYYTVLIGSQSYRVNIICEPIYSTYPIHFLNKYGGFETKLFNKVSRRTIDIQRKDYGRLPFLVDAGGIPSYKSSNGVYNESRSVYSVQYKEKMALNSDLLTDSEYIWLEELIVSPMVYLEDSGYFFPAVITDNNYEPKKNINDDLTNLVINIEFGQTLNSQYR